MPQTNYEYRLIAGDEGTDWMPLRTDGGGPFKALIFPDSQSSDYIDWKNLAGDAFRRNPDASFFTNLGDLVDNGEEHSQWDAWFDAVTPFADRIPFAHIRNVHRYENGDFTEVSHRDRDGDVGVLDIIKALYDNGFEG